MQSELTLSEFQLLERTKSVYERLPSIAGFTFTLLALTTFILLPAHELKHLLIWMVAGSLVLVARWYRWWVYKHCDLTPESAQKWHREMMMFSAASGMVWGAMWVFFIDPEQSTFVLFLVCVYTGYVSSSMSAIGFSYPVFIAFSLPMAMTLFLRSIYEGGYFFYSVAIMTLVYNVVLVQFSRKSHQMFDDRVRLTFENQQLITQIRSQKAEVESALLAKDTFLAAASHDLRQPLHSLGMFIEILRDRTADQEQQLLINKLSQSTSALNDLLHSLLDISRFDANVVENHPRPMDLADLITRICRDYKAQAAEQNTTLSFQVESPTVIEFDVILMERLLRNLIDNAVKFTVNGRVDIAASVRSNHVEVSIKDTGSGIPKQDHERVFSEFTQLENPERDRSKGLGLGLAIVRRLCRLTNLDLELKSAPGEGTEFYFRLPLKDSSELAEIPTLDAGANVEGYVVGLIDDELDVLEGVSIILQDAGAQVYSAVDANTLIAALHETDREPDVIVADFRLRANNNGIDAIQRVREEFNRDIPAILVTGDTSPDRIAEADQSQLPVLHKPVSPAELLSAIAVEMRPQPFAKTE